VAGLKEIARVARGIFPCDRAKNQLFFLRYFSRIDNCNMGSHRGAFLDRQAPVTVILAGFFHL
jgi:hypothetical protein